MSDLDYVLRNLHVRLSNPPQTLTPHPRLLLTRPDSNRQPLDYQASALSIELRIRADIVQNKKVSFSVWPLLRPAYLECGINLSVLKPMDLVGFEPTADLS